MEEQTLTKDRWELLLIDNASDGRLAENYDLSWHPQARHVREDCLGLTPARLRGIREATGGLLVFVDDDNVLAPDFLEEAAAIHERYPYLGAFGAGRLRPEFEIEPPSEIRPHLKMLALRSVSSARWSNNARDADSIPWGAGLCACRQVVTLYRNVVESLEVPIVLDRRGKELQAGGDDLFSWVAASAGFGFGIFPQLRITHLIVGGRLNQRYFLRLIETHRFSHGVLDYMLEGIQPHRLDWLRYVRLALHGMRNGRFSMRCRWAGSRGEDRAARFISANNLHPIDVAGRPNLLALAAKCR